MLLQWLVVPWLAVFVENRLEMVDTIARELLGSKRSAHVGRRRRGPFARFTLAQRVDPAILDFSRRSPNHCYFTAGGEGLCGDLLTTRPQMQRSTYCGRALVCNIGTACRALHFADASDWSTVSREAKHSTDTCNQRVPMILRLGVLRTRRLTSISSSWTRRFDARASSTQGCAGVIFLRHRQCYQREPAGSSLNEIGSTQGEGLPRRTGSMPHRLLPVFGIPFLCHFPPCLSAWYQSATLGTTRIAPN